MSRRLALLALAAALIGPASATAAPSDLDTSFAGKGYAFTSLTGAFPSALAQQPDGKLVSAGSSNGANDDFTVVRYRTDGTPDPAFGGGDGVVMISMSPEYDSAGTVVILPDGRILLAGVQTTGSDMRIALVRLTPGGDPDPTLDGDGDADGKVIINLPGSTRESLTDVVLLPGGGFWGGGTYRVGGDDQLLLARFTASGALDTSYDGDGYRATTAPGQDDLDVATMLAQPDGKLVFGGEAYDGSATQNLLARFTAEGVPDSSFDGDGISLLDLQSSGEGLNDIALDGFGRVVGTGYADVGTSYVASVFRVTPAGALDGGFGSGGSVLYDLPGPGGEDGDAVALQSNGRIVVLATTGDLGSSRLFFARLGRDGARDTSFAPDGVRVHEIPESADEFSEDLLVQSDGRLAAAGSSFVSGERQFLTVRLEGSPPDRDDDGVPDATDACPDTAASTTNGCPAPPPAPPLAPLTPLRDVFAPVVASASMTNTTFAVASGPTAVVAQRRRRARVRRGTAFRFSLSEPATVTIAIRRRARGRRVGRTCSLRPRRRGRRCTKIVVAGTLVRRNLRAGPQRIAFTGRIGRRALRAATYQAVIVATDAAGNRSAPRVLRFGVVRQPARRRS
jgi:uncharacterized delta-60 repeat protein